VRIWRSLRSVFFVSPVFARFLMWTLFSGSESSKWGLLSLCYWPLTLQTFLSHISPVLGSIFKCLVSASRKSFQTLC
jgi:hypothetical protein